MNSCNFIYVNKKCFCL